VWLHEENQDHEVIPADPEDIPANLLPDPDVQMDYAEQADMPTLTKNAKTQQYYIREFVKRVHPMLTALLAREVPERLTCSQCTNGHMARWRCRDCNGEEMICRGCMRKTHVNNPLHRVEMWTGTCFRRAQLWQVGVYILIPHHFGERLCATLAWNQNLLEGFQRNHDEREQAELGHGWPPPEEPVSGQEAMTEENDSNRDLGGMNDAEFDEHIDQLYDQHRGLQTGQDIMEEEEEAEEEDDIPLMTPPDYMPGPEQIARQHTDPSRMPRADALDNPFVRLVHTNGVHHIVVVSCTCRGRENTHCDLMAACLVPTSFIRYRTMFTHAVLDDFRLENLECKASAYQYFQKLRRLTSAMCPDSVPNLYHELRRMSRLWRWMKKLKWSGTEHELPSTSSSVPGDLANFCPTCPQPGINLPENWQLDPNKCATELRISVLLLTHNVGGFTNDLLWPTGTSRPITYGKKIQGTTCG
jgi:hypothetical protein